MSSSQNIIRLAPRHILFIEGVADDGMARVQLHQNNKTTDPSFKLFMSGSLQHSAHIAVADTVNDTVMMVGGEEQSLNLKMPAVVVNCVVDPDSSVQALIKAHKLIEHIQQSAKKPVPVINPPQAIKETTRETMYAKFSGLAGLVFPRVIRITPDSVADVVRQAKEAGMSLPFIIRPVGKHGGVGLQAIENFSQAELLKLERYAYDGSHFYITEWTDFKNADGLYRKSRLICVNGRFIPRHRIINDSWMIHSKSRKTLMHDRADLRAEEEAFLTQPLAKSVSKEAMDALSSIADQIGLDYFGVDCAIRDDGSLIIFEINAAFNAMVQDDLDIFPYLAKPVAAIKGAFNDMVAEKVNARRAA